MNSKHRIQNFWKSFMLVKADLQKAMKEENIDEYSHILKDLNEKLKRYVRVEWKLK